MNLRSLRRVALGVAIILLGIASLAHAGPPLVCHPIEIGQAKSLPWVDLNDHQGSTNYDLQNLTRDTLALLDSNRTVLLHMETLRRATLYARQNPQAAKELLTRVDARAAHSDSGDAAALAWFDAGYLAEAYKQWIGKDEPNPASGLDGYAWVNKAIALRGSDPQMEFAAALITLTVSQQDHAGHVAKALAGAKTDPLLAQNLASTFHHQTISALLTRDTSQLVKQ
jgi:hypothetical protein